MTAHLDTFAHDNLPPRAQWPDFLFDLPELKYPQRMNCVVELLDRWVAAGYGDRPCLISPAETLTYAQLAERVNRIANVLTHKLGVVPGHRVLLRGPNNPMMVAAYLGVVKAGGVVVATMPLLRAKEIAYPIAKAKIRLALCDHRLAEEMEKARALAPDLERVVYWGSGAPDALEALMATPGYEVAVSCDTWRSGIIPAARWCRVDPDREGISGRSPRGNRAIRRHHRFHRAHRLSRDAGKARPARRFLAAQMRVGR